MIETKSFVFPVPVGIEASQNDSETKHRKSSACSRTDNREAIRHAYNTSSTLLYSLVSTNSVQRYNFFVKV